MSAVVVHTPVSRGGPFRRWECHHEFTPVTRPVAIGRDRSAVQLDESLDDGKADTETVSPALVKHLEDTWEPLSRDSSAGISHMYDDLRFLPLDEQVDRSPVRS